MKINLHENSKSEIEGGGSNAGLSAKVPTLQYFDDMKCHSCIFCIVVVLNFSWDTIGTCERNIHNSCFGYSEQPFFCITNNSKIKFVVFAIILTRKES